MSWCSRRKEGRTNPRDNLGRERLVFTRRRAPTKGECSSFFFFFFFFFFFLTIGSIGIVFILISI